MMPQRSFFQQIPVSIRTKLLVAVMLVVLVPLLGTALYGNWFTGNVIQDEVIRSSQDELAPLRTNCE